MIGTVDVVDSLETERGSGKGKLYTVVSRCKQQRTTHTERGAHYTHEFYAGSVSSKRGRRHVQIGFAKKLDQVADAHRREFRRTTSCKTREKRRSCEERKQIKQF